MATLAPPWQNNPFTAGTSDYVDFELWKAGVDRFLSTSAYLKKKGTTPHELDYLRGMHDPLSLKLLRDFLINNLGTPNVKITSVWLDKTAKVAPVGKGIDPSNRELGDLAVVVRRLDPIKDFTSMWVLQAKKLPLPTSTLPHDISTKKEIELLEKCPDFDFIRADKTKCRIELQSDFGKNHLTYKHWAFLTLFNDPALYTPTRNPNQWRWSGTDASPSIGSFSQAVLDQASDSGKIGAHVDPKAASKQWRKLWLELMQFGVSKPASGFAGGNVQNVVGLLLGLDWPLTAWLIAYPRLLFPNLATDFEPYELGNETIRFTSTGLPKNANVSLEDIDKFESWSKKTLAHSAADHSTNHENNGEAPPPPEEPTREDDDGGGGIKSMLIVDVLGSPEELH